MNDTPTSKDPDQRIREVTTEFEECSRRNERLVEGGGGLALLMDTLPYPTLCIRRDRTVLWANRAAVEAGARVGGLCWRDFGHADYIPMEHRAYLEHHGEAPPEGTCCTFCRADEAMEACEPASDPEVHAFERIWNVHWVPVDEETYLHYALDVTEKVRSEKALRESEERFRIQAENATDVIFVLDPRYRLTYINPAVEAMFGRSQEEVLSLPWEHLFTPESVHRIRGAMQRRKASPGGGLDRSPYRLELEHVQRDGSLVDVEVVSTPLISEEGEFTGVVGVMRDVTERKREARQKERSLVRLHQEHKTESLERMAGAVAHQFNNQLSVVMGNLELALGALGEDDEIRGYLSESMAAARKSAATCGMILTYLGQTGGEQEPLDLSETCRTCLPVLRGVVSEGATLETAFPASGPCVRAHAPQLQQVLHNLVRNAAESLEQGQGRIRLSAGVVKGTDVPDGRCFPAGWSPSEADHARLEVSDTGRGIEEEVIDKIFDPFYSDKFAGRGLGLSTVLGIVTAHGGGLVVRSRPGRGSSFQVLLPVSGEPLPGPSDASSEPLEDKARGAVLLVEDQAPVRRMAVRMLEDLGFEVLATASGGEALERLRENRDRVQCVLTDLTMPGMNGWETLSALREMRPDLPAILVSGYEETQAMGGSSPAKAQAFLHKPYTREELRAALDRVLKR